MKGRALGRPQTLILLVDALGWEVASHFGFGAGEFATRAPLGTVLGYSTSAIPSLLTGTLPGEHGSFAMFRAARGRGTFSFLRGVPPLPHALDWRARRFARRWLERRGTVRAYYDLYEIPVHLLHRFDVGQIGNPFDPGGATRETVFDWMRDRDFSYQLWDYRTPEEANLDAAVAAVGGEARVLFVYTAELDSLMHRVGTEHASVGARLARYARFVADARERASARDVALDVVVLSDHGMTPVHASVDPWGELARRGLVLGRDYLAFFDSTMARLWGDARAESACAEAFGGGGRLLGEDELEGLGCSFEDHAYGRSIYLAAPGVLIVPSFMGSKPVAAMHGYHPDDRHSRGVFMTNASTPAPDSILGFKAFLQQVLQ